MPKIQIKEQVTTGYRSFAEDFDVVFVPGLVDPDLADGLPYGEARLFSSVKDFKAACGDKPVTFSADQKYATLVITGEGEDSPSVTGFADNAIPVDGVMFTAGASDPGYLYAIEMLNAGLSVLYQRINPDGDNAWKSDEYTIAKIYSELAKVYTFDEAYSSGLVDRGNYSVKYLTSGGYPTYEYNSNSIALQMLSLARTRGDCVALIDHTDNTTREKDISKPSSLYYTVNTDESLDTNGDYGAMFTPAAEFVMLTQNETARMPASFGYLLALADSVKSNAPWLAVAGAARGGLVNLAPQGMTTVIPNGVADLMQSREGKSINAITNIKPYGFTIWGNRTLKQNVNGLEATSFLSVRNLVSDVKKVCYNVARSLTFEQDNDVTWVNFKSGIATTLDKMVSGYGISGYKIIKDEDRDEAQEKGVICAKIYLYPVYPVEDFYIDIILSDDDVTVQ